MKYFIGILIGSVFLGAYFEWRNIDTTEVNFRTACDAVKGQTVWNGRYWEC